MKTFLQITKDDNIWDIPQHAVKSVLFAVADQMFSKQANAAIKASPPNDYADVLADLLPMYFERTANGHTLFVEVKEDIEQEPLPVESDPNNASIALGFLPQPQQPQRTIYVPSRSRANKFHPVVVRGITAVRCGCEAFTYRGTCRHLREAEDSVRRIV